MTSIWHSLFQEEGLPLRRAFLFLLLTAPSFGTIGVFTSMKHLQASLGSLAHASIAGIGIAAYARFHWKWGWLTPQIGMLGVCILAALAIFFVEIRNRKYQDILLNIIWASGTAIGLLLLSLVPGSTNVSSFLWGNLLFIQPKDLWYVFYLDIAVFAALLLPWPYHQQAIFDPEFAKTRGIRNTSYQLIFYLLLAYMIITAISVAGILLTLGLLSLPVAIGKILARSFLQCITYTILTYLVLSHLSLFWSLHSNLSPSGLMILLFAAIYVLLLLAEAILKKVKSRPR